MVLRSIELVIKIIISRINEMKLQDRRTEKHLPNYAFIVRWLCKGRSLFLDLLRHWLRVVEYLYLPIPGASGKEDP
jgi:hypothetical protein